MSRISSFLLGMATGALLLHVAMTYHLVRAGDGLHFVPKAPPRLAEAYVDVREFGMSDWAGRPQLAAALVQADKQHLVGDSAANALQSNVEQLLPNWPQK